jgi:fructose transport system substrate-binding protein
MHLAPGSRVSCAARRSSRLRRTPRRGLVLAVVAALSLTLAGCDRSGGRPIVGLITKTDTNPFFVKMKDGASTQASDEGLKLQSFAGKQDGDNESQVQAIENLI